MNYNPYNRKDEQRPVEYQQFFPGFSPGPPGQRPQEPPGPPRQRPQGPSGPPGQRPQGPSGPPGQRPQEPSGPPGQRPQGPSGPPGQRPQGPSGPPGQRPQGPPGQGRPGMQPPSAPPNFTPQLPREEQQFLSGPSDFRGPFGGRIIDSRTRPRDFSRCMNRFTYIWLINGNNFWFYPVFIGRNTIEGFRWRRNRWDYERININRILFHLCF